MLSVKNRLKKGPEREGATSTGMCYRKQERTSIPEFMLWNIECCSSWKTKNTQSRCPKFANRTRREQNYYVPLFKILMEVFYHINVNINCAVKTTCLRERAFLPMSLSSASSSQIPDPRPPSAYADRIITGNPIFFAAQTAASSPSTASDWATFSPISINVFCIDVCMLLSMSI